MSLKEFFQTAFLALWVLGGVSSAALEKPNLVIIMADVLEQAGMKPGDGVGGVAGAGQRLKVVPDGMPGAPQGPHLGKKRTSSSGWIGLIS